MTKIVVTIEAEDGNDLRRQLMNMLGAFNEVPKFEYADIRPFAPKDPATGEPVPEDGPAEATGKPVESDEPETAPEAQPAKKTRQRAPAAPQKAKTKPVEETAPVNGHDEAPAEVIDTAALIDLKARTMDQLQKAFENGKVKEVRALLAAHGNGAKTFREIEADAFPVIAKAIEAGALS